MSTKVKRGLGLLVVAAIGFLVLLVTMQIPADGIAAQVIVIAGLLAGLLALFGGLVGGLVLLAWGLLRD